MLAKYFPKRKRSLTLIAILCTFFVDNLSWSIVYPVFAPFFLNPSAGAFSSPVTIATRTAVLGLYLSVFHFAQFLFSPLIGEFSDRNGRRKAFLYTIFCTFIGCALSAIGMQRKSLMLLFFGRAVTGVFSGNLSICLAAIADLSEKSGRKLTHFGHMALVAGSAFIFGAYLGGKLSDHTLSPYFFLALPFWISGLMTFLNYLFVFCFFNEPFVKNREIKFHLSEGFKNIATALRAPNIKRLYLIYFLFLLAWNVVLQFSPILAVTAFGFSTSELGNFIAFLGICWGIGSGILTKPCLQWFNNRSVLWSCLLLFSLCAFLIIFPQKPLVFMALVGASVMISGVAWPVCTEMISSKANKNMQGKVLGLSQSIQSFAMGLAPLAALLTYAAERVPFTLGGVLCSWAFWLFIQKRP